jgi:ssDNA-binding Zn-finger/Zn-ribbon topoisomerase 1
MNGQTTQLNTPPAQCPECGGNIILKQGTKPDGSAYRFYGCSNYKDLGCKFIWRPPAPQKAFVGSMLTKDTFIKGLGLLRGDIKRIEDKITQLLNVSVIYPADSPVETGEKVVERKVVPMGEPPEQPPAQENMGLEDL